MKYNKYKNNDNDVKNDRQNWKKRKEIKVDTSEAKEFKEE